MSKFDINSFISTPDVMKNSVRDIPVEKLKPYKNHCFKLYEGERLDDMVRSVSEHGIMIPIIVRTITNSDDFEILSGHNRVNAARIVGKKTVPVVVKENLPDEFAEIYVVETNAMQRGFKELRISEQAFAVAIRYKSLFDSEKIQLIDEELKNLAGEKVQSPLGTDKMSTAADEYGLGRNTIARLLRINTLADDLKNMVDEGNIKIRPAVELSYISKEMQKMLFTKMAENEVSVIDMKMAKQLREISQSYTSPSEDLIVEVLCGTYGDEPIKKDKGEKVTIPTATYTRYLGGYSKKDANIIIEKALALYFENNEEETA